MNIKAIVLTFTLLLTGIAQAEEGMLPATPYARIPTAGPKMLEFGATSCVSCQKMDRLLFELKKENPSLPLYFVNVLQDREAAAKFRIRMIPTQVFINAEGKIAGTHIGLLKKEELLQRLERYGIVKRSKDEVK